MKDKETSLKIQELTYELKIMEAMSKDIITVSPDDTIYEVRQILKENRISGIPVVDDKKLVGIISLENFIKCIMNGGVDNKVSDNMSSDIKCLYSDEPLVTAIRKFDELGYGRFPIVKRNDGELVGIITKGDIMRCLLKKLEIDYQEDEISKYRASHIFEDIVSDDTAIIFKYRIKGGNYEMAGEQSGYLKINLLRLGIHPKKTRQVTIASCEAEMNIIIFAEKGELVITVEKDRIKVNAIDDGPGIADIEKAMIPGFSTAPDWVREMGFGAGMGLPNIKKCSDEMRITSDINKGTNLEFIVRTYA
jgi:CBS domain-containing protein/anti-sigma regulatory factor (Ser/Thr protein kinase)